MIWWAIGAAVAGVLISLNLPLNFAGVAERVIYVILATSAALLLHLAMQSGTA